MNEIVTAYSIYMLLATFGLTLGYHRYFSHYEFTSPKWFEVVMLVAGAICGGRDPIGWVGVHRMHHRYSDTDNDPQAAGWKALFSAWKVPTVPIRYVRDLYRNPRVKWFHHGGAKSVWVISGILCALIGYFEIWIYIQLLSWAGFGIINYFGHLGGKPRNFFLINLIAPFEGNHKDHHVLSNAPVIPEQYRNSN